MFTPRITETPLFVARTEHDDFADEPAPQRHGENAEQFEHRPRKPRSRPYDRAAQREMVRESLNLHLHTHAYDQEG